MGGQSLADGAFARAGGYAGRTAIRKLSMHTGNFDEALEKIVAKDRRYHRDAYLFLREALDHTQKIMAKAARETREGPKEETVKHVSGQELLNGIRALALEQFGPMAATVFAEWGVRRCEDFGEIVFNMVDNHLLAKTKDDSREDFRGGYDFEEAFSQPFLPPSRQATPAQPATKASKS
jgi:uncharacterized repeat protein (TIGR04138 family)